MWKSHCPPKSPYRSSSIFCSIFYNSGYSFKFLLQGYHHKYYKYYKYYSKTYNIFDIYTDTQKKSASSKIVEPFYIYKYIIIIKH